MKKQILAAAIVAAIAAPAASFAAVDVSARIQGEVSSVDNHSTFDGVSVNGGDDSSNDDDANFVAFTGSEKLGNGWTAFGKINFAFDSTSQGAFTSRDKFVGLKNDLVSLSVGRLNSAYKKASVKYDPFLGTSLQARGNGGQTGGAGLGHFAHSSYIDDAVEVALHTGAFSFTGQYVADEQGNPDVANAKDGSYSLNAKYAVGSGIELIGAVSKAEVGQEDFNNYKIGAHYRSGPLALAAEYENAEMGVLADNGITGGNNDEAADVYLASATYDLGNITLASWVSYYNQDDLDGTNFALGGFYHFSQRASVYAGYRSLDVSGDVRGVRQDQEEDVWATGLRFTL